MEGLVLFFRKHIERSKAWSIPCNRINIPLILLWLLPLAPVSAADYTRVLVADPYIEIHTGPGRGYPVFHVVERHEWVEIIKRKNDWFKVQDRDGNVGWVLIDQMEKTLLAPDVPTHIERIAEKHFGERTFEFGVQYGDFEGAALMSLYAGYNFNANLSVELIGNQASGELANSTFGKLGFVSTPFPKWIVSPFFTIGGGYIKTEPKSFVFAEGRDDTLAYVGLGLRYYMSRRVFFRADVIQNVVFIDERRNGEFLEWKLGLSFFF